MEKMNSYFNSLLTKKKLSKHDGRPLWKYNLSDEEYSDLKIHLSQITITNFDPRDITLLYAEWWKNEYKGGAPSKIDVFNSIKKSHIVFEDFYRYAKRGASLLGIKWIQREKTLYFRTLLMQGGLPINHLLNNSGIYTSFLKKVLEINPSTINEFAYESDIISILPYSSRNEAIYESCLQIVQAIWNGNEEYLAIFENKSSSTTSFKKISDELKRHKEVIEKTVKRRSKFRAFWVLHTYENQNQIKLEFNFPDIIEVNDFTDLINDSVIKSEYHLIINDSIVCKFKRNVKGDYKILWFLNTSIFWDGEEKKPEIYLSSPDGNKYEFANLLMDSPKTSIPTLWTQKSEYEWILSRGRHCKQEKAAVLFSNEWKVDYQNNYTALMLNGQKLNWIEFEGNITLNNKNTNDDPFIFRTNTTPFNWYLKENKPSWVVKSNLPIVATAPQIFAFNKDNERINKIILYWRLSGEIVWKKWSSNLPQGCIEYKINVNGCEEKDYFYNISNLSLEYHHEGPNKASIKINNGNDLIFSIKQSELFGIQQNDKSLTLSLSDVQKIPKSIGASIIHGDQKRSLHLEIVPPFYGINLFDPNGNKLDSDSILLLSNFKGYRIIAPYQTNFYYLKLYNIKKPHINLIRKLHSIVTPLREYEEYVIRLFQLTDSMDVSLSIAIELINYDGTILSKYYVKNYNKSLSYEYVDRTVEINLDESSNEIELFAIPLECSADNIELLPITKLDNNKFALSLDASIFDKFIIFSDLDINSKISPCFLSTNSQNIPTTEIERTKRIKGYREDLATENANQNSWKIIHKYFKICIVHGIQFSTFDVFRAAVSTPELIAKLFCFLCVYNEETNFLEQTCKELEDNLGFCFHWVSNIHWNNAIDWIKTSFESEIKLEEIDLIINNLARNIYYLINNNEPIEYYAKIADYIVNKRIERLTNFMIKVEQRNLRQNLGDRVLKELPNHCPKIKEQYKNILPVTADNAIIKILLKVPIAIALSISGKDETIWNEDEDIDTIHRNIQYCQWIAPEWYSKSILYCLNRL